MNCSMPGFPVHHQLLELTLTHVHWVVMPSNHLILCCPLLLLPSIFPSIGVFSSESVLPISWPNYWSFSFSISPFIEYSGLISFRMYGFQFIISQDYSVFPINICWKVYLCFAVLRCYHFHALLPYALAFVLDFVPRFILSVLIPTPHCFLLETCSMFSYLIGLVFHCKFESP